MHCRPDMALHHSLVQCLIRRVQIMSIDDHKAIAARLDHESHRRVVRGEPLCLTAHCVGRPDRIDEPILAIRSSRLDLCFART
jgi:hypothetical protein